MDLSLYVHYPFCPRKCPYCAFNSTSDSPCTPDDYVSCLVNEMRHRSMDLIVDMAAVTLYFGGGTPSLMPASLVSRLIAAAREFFFLTPDAEITMECNPGTVTRKKLRAFRAAGVNRISLGVQSFDDGKLRHLGRIHTAAQAVDAFSAARDAGFDNVGLDLIHSVMGETLKLWESDLNSACALYPEHLSVYGLTIEDGTQFAFLESEGKIHQPDDEQCATMYEKSSEILCDFGYDHYELANFARPGFRSRHNCGYWERRSCIGFGAGAHSFLRLPGFGVRFSNVENSEEYLRSVSAGFLPTCEVRKLTLKEAMAEQLFLGLRMSEGINIAQFEKDFGISFDEVYGASCANLFSSGFIEICDGRLRLLPKARVVSNQVFVKFL